MTPVTYNSTIPHRIIYYTAAEEARWTEAWNEWIASDRTAWSAWQEFEPIARSQGFPLSEGNGGHFAESRIAKELHDEGYSYWQANRCHLFLKHNRGGKSKAQTDIVERLLEAEGHPNLREFRRRLSFKPRDVDLVGHHPRHGWRFCEVKWKEEPLRPGQLETLAFLQNLLGAAVEVARVVPERHQRQWPDELNCTYTLT